MGLPLGFWASPTPAGGAEPRIDNVAFVLTLRYVSPRCCIVDQVLGCKCMPTAAARFERRGRSKRKPESKSKSGPMSLRMDDETRSLIDRAARVRGQNRTEFMLSSARQIATEVLLNQTLFVLSGSDWDDFVDVLDNPPAPNERLRDLFARRPPWENQD